MSSTRIGTRGLCIAVGKAKLESGKQKLETEIRNWKTEKVRSLGRLVLAALVQHRQDHQVRTRKQPLFRLLTHRLRGARDKADAPSAGEMVETLEADARQRGSLRVCKDLLAGLDLDHAFVLVIDLLKGDLKSGDLGSAPWFGVGRGYSAGRWSWIRGSFPPDSHYSWGVRGLSIEWGQQFIGGRARVVRSGKALRRKGKLEGRRQKLEMGKRKMED